ncbi:Fibronectin type III domain-containing protein 4 [Saguinus oedipus]|uniref:Fibronectin type III domain-containing protein 4 n=1 Tax=Saguinus oedipus TaxID=9490 RepID=A0ABQ9T9D6_SAGOE|nr:Fibronectin type III domain-containing protein 4 [Saguinus oedipus]
MSSGCPSAPPADSCLDVEESRLSLVAWHWVEAGLLPLISLQRQNGPGQRVIPEANTTTRAGAFWGLAEDSDYTVQVRSIGLRGESPPWLRVHFRTLKGSDRLPSNSSGPGEGLRYWILWLLTRLAASFLLPQDKQQSS